MMDRFILLVVLLIALLDRGRGFLVRVGSGGVRVPHQQKFCATWQQDLDDALELDTSCEARQEKLQGLIQNRASEIQTDLRQAIQNRDRRLIAPTNTKYGKALEGLVSFRKQLISDIIPELLTKGVPTLIREGPKLIEDLNSAVAEAPKRGQQLVEQIRDISSDASALQSTTEELRREVKNVFRSTPEGLDTPAYSVMVNKNGVQAKGYEVRSYSGYSVCTSNDTKAEGGQALSSGRSFNTLASYLFGGNVQGESMSMTTPVIMSDGAMSFVLPRGKSAKNAPLPKDDKVVVRDVEPVVVAAREFTGICTEALVAEQRALLEDALFFDGVAFDNLTFQVLQYNPPYTLPWLRRNEVMLKITSLDTFSSNSNGNGVSEESVAVESFEQAPEAGD